MGYSIRDEEGRDLGYGEWQDLPPSADPAKVAERIVSIVKQAA